VIRIAILVVVVAAVGLGAIGWMQAGHGELPGIENRMLVSDLHELGALAAAVAMLAIVLPAIFGAYRGRIGGAMRDLLSWCAIGLILVGGYSYRDELGQIAYRIAGEFSPPGSTLGVEQRQAGESAVRIRRRGDGHFVARVSVDGASVSMLVDTGASTIVLRQADARLLGVDTSRLRYTVPVQTANGIAYAAHARLGEVSVGSIKLRSVDALVAQPGVLKESLLGMSFLSQLRSYEFAGEFLTFRN
jgi:aspartyl protease family protein